MKKLPLFLLLIFAMSCGDEDLDVKPNGEDFQTVGIIEETESESSDIHLFVDESATFPGGMKAYSKFLKTNLKYPLQAKKMGIEGKAFMSFVVDADGSLSDFKLLRGIGAGCDEEALRVIMSSPKWIPGKQAGVAVKTKMNLRVVFKLDNADIATNSIEEVIKEKPAKEDVQVIHLDVEEIEESKRNN